MKKNAYAIQTRREQIRTRLKETGEVSVYEMSRLFEVSESTIRRDLEALVDGQVVRYHGGIKIAEPERRFEEKSALSAENKNLIAEEAAKLVHSGQTVFLNAGTTTLSLFRQIRDRDICIITNNTATVMEPGEFRAELILVGGQYRSRTRSLAGGIAGSTFSQVYADICFLGTNGVSLQRGLTTTLHQEAEVNRAMANRAKEVVCIADSSKLGVDAGFVTLPLSRLSSLITDSGAEPEMLGQFETMSLDIILAEQKDRF